MISNQGWDRYSAEDFLGWVCSVTKDFQIAQFVNKFRFPNSYFSCTDGRPLMIKSNQLSLTSLRQPLCIIKNRYKFRLCLGKVRLSWQLGLDQRSCSSCRSIFISLSSVLDSVDWHPKKAVGARTNIFAINQGETSNWACQTGAPP